MAVVGEAGVLRSGAVLAVASLAPAMLAAQLIAPGKLARPHSTLEGVSRCTACHVLGSRGVEAARCLRCHQPLARGLAVGRGLHASFGDRPCAECHKDHFGLGFALVQLDTAMFDHRTTGYPLRLAHGTVACRSCHRPENIVLAEVRDYAAQNGVLDRTYLGLGTQCAGCHRRDDPHGRQFASRGCDDCHDEATWKRAVRFAHQRTRYPLTGLHARVECEKCHRPVPGGLPGSAVQYAGTPFANCVSCHSDPHRGMMPGGCESCHTTDGWRRLDRRTFEAAFDHARTGFVLAGAHARAACAACHQPRAPGDAAIRLRFAAPGAMAAYPRPAASECLSCHLDPHGGVLARLPGGARCDNCHGQESWRPATYDIARHNRETYALTGAHLTVPCGQCHPRSAPREPPRFRLGELGCGDCHAQADPHAGQFAGRSCSACHSTAAFRIAAFDHSTTRYPLDGAHRSVACAACHPQEAGQRGATVRYRPLSTDCRSCHGASP